MENNTDDQGYLDKMQYISQFLSTSKPGFTSTNKDELSYLQGFEARIIDCIKEFSGSFQIDVGTLLQIISFIDSFVHIVRNDSLNQPKQLNGFMNKSYYNKGFSFNSTIYKEMNSTSLVAELKRYCNDYYIENIAFAIFSLISKFHGCQAKFKIKEFKDEHSNLCLNIEHVNKLQRLILEKTKYTLVSPNVHNILDLFSELEGVISKDMSKWIENSYNLNLKVIDFIFEDIENNLELYNEYREFYYNMPILTAIGIMLLWQSSEKKRQNNIWKDVYLKLSISLIEVRDHTCRLHTFFQRISTHKNWTKSQHRKKSLLKYDLSLANKFINILTLSNPTALYQQKSILTSKGKIKSTKGIDTRLATFHLNAPIPNLLNTISIDFPAIKPKILAARQVPESTQSKVTNAKNNLKQSNEYLVHRFAKRSISKSLIERQLKSIEKTKINLQTFYNNNVMINLKLVGLK